MVKVTWSNKKSSAIKGNVTVVGAFDGTGSNGTLITHLGAKYKDTFKRMNFKPTLGNTLLTQNHTNVVLVVGLGSAKELSLDTLRRACASASRAVSSFDIAVVDLGETASSVLSPDVVARGIYEGFALGLYNYSKYKAGNNTNIKSVVIADVTKASTVKTFEKVAKISNSVIWARDAINTPPNGKAPKEFAKNIATFLKATNLKIEILDEATIKRKKMVGVIAVGQGSYNKPAFVRVSYKSPGAKKTVALVGKGVIFDSGGLSIKVGDGMATMKCDMSGAAAVVGAMKSISQIKPKVNVEAYIPLVENMPGGGAFRVSDILEYRNGVSVEVGNTDAEGRLILADGLIWASETKPDVIIDLATLTGAIVIALGEKIAAAMSNNDNMRTKVLEASERAGERFWPMPLPEDYRKDIDTPVADVINTGKRYGSSLTAGLFLREFVGDVPWVHLDIAGPAFLDSTDGENIAGGTGFAVRTLVEFVETF